MRNLILSLAILMFFVPACQSGKAGGNSGGISDWLDSSDETERAVELTNRANEDLREIRKIQKANRGKDEELGNALKEKNSAEARQILDGLIKAIEEGLSLGEAARSRIEEAGEKKTNEKFNDYLRLKEQAMQKQIDAFTFRLQTAKTLREKFGTNDTAEIERAKGDFARQEDSFKKLWEAAEELNDQADQLARANAAKVKVKQ